MCRHESASYLQNRTTVKHTAADRLESQDTWFLHRNIIIIIIFFFNTIMSGGRYTAVSLHRKAKTIPLKRIVVVQPNHSTGGPTHNRVGFRDTGFTVHRLFGVGSSKRNLPRTYVRVKRGSNGILYNYIMNSFCRCAPTIRSPNGTRRWTCKE